MGPTQIVQILQMKMTCHGRRPQNIQSGISQQPLIGSSQILNLSLYDQIIFCKSFIWRWPPLEGNTIKIEISQQPLIGSYSDFTLMLR